MLADAFQENLYLRAERALGSIGIWCYRGYPVVDCSATLYDGSYHDVDSSELAFKVAASMAFRTAMKMASPVLLEPIMKVVVETPEEFMVISWVI